MFGVLEGRAVPDAVDLDRWGGLGGFPIVCSRPLSASVMFASNEKADPPWVACELFERAPSGPGASWDALLVAYGDETVKDYDLLVENPEPVAHAEDLHVASRRPTPSGPLAELVGKPCWFVADEGRLEIRERSDAILEYADADWFWTRNKLFGWRNIHRVADLKSITGAPGRVARGLGLARSAARSLLPVFVVIGLALVSPFALKWLLRAPEAVVEVAVPAVVVTPSPPPVHLTRTCNVRSVPSTAGSRVLGSAGRTSSCVQLGKDDAGWTNVRCGALTGWIGPVCVR